MRTREFRQSLVVFVLALVVLGAGACGSSTSATPAVGSAAPAAVRFIPLDQFSVATYTGKPLVVNVFGSWCEYCKAEAPDLATFWKANPQVAFVGVATSDTAGAVRSFMGKYGLGYPVVLDDGRLSASWGIQGVPTTIFYNARGREVDRIVGAASLERFQAGLAKTR